jgi:peptidoglycan/xylan/chitin deacetylase (PgdA/CDA1 family)
MLLYLFLFLTIAFCYYFASTFFSIRGIHDYVLPGAIFKNASERITLTFDDGPHPEYTPHILKLLNRFNIHAIFFIKGEKAVHFPELLRCIKDQGHEIGNHTWSHAWLPVSGKHRIQEEISKCQELINDITQQQGRYFRPPHGARDIRVYKIASKNFLKTVMWSKDSLDWAGLSTDSIYKRLNNAKGGDIVLLHDGNETAKNLVPALERWLQEKHKQLTFGLPE